MAVSEYFSGVSLLLVCSNCKRAVVCASRHGSLDVLLPSQVPGCSKAQASVPAQYESKKFMFQCSLSDVVYCEVRVTQVANVRFRCRKQFCS